MSHLVLLMRHLVTQIEYCSLRTKYPPPTLPTGVDITAVEAQLAPSDWQKTFAATTMATNVVAFLYTASLPPPPPPSGTSQSARGGTVTDSNSISSLSFE